MDKVMDKKEIRIIANYIKKRLIESFNFSSDKIFISCDPVRLGKFDINLLNQYDSLSYYDEIMSILDAISDGLFESKGYKIKYQIMWPNRLKKRNEN